MQPSSNPLNQLADIHLPSGVSWWPLAPGWWILLALALLITLASYLWQRRKKQNRYRQIAQQQLAAIYADYQHSHNSAAYLQGLSVLLRRTALTAYPQSFNPSIKGQAWLQWLDSVCPDLAEPFAGDAGRALITGAYEKDPQVDVQQLQQLSAKWIELHYNHRQKIPAGKTPKPPQPPLPREEAKHV